MMLEWSKKIWAIQNECFINNKSIKLSKHREKSNYFPLGRINEIFFEMTALYVGWTVIGSRTYPTFFQYLGLYIAPSCLYCMNPGMVFFHRTARAT